MRQYIRIYLNPEGEVEHVCTQTTPITIDPISDSCDAHGNITCRYRRLDFVAGDDRDNRPFIKASKIKQSLGSKLREQNANNQP